MSIYKYHVYSNTISRTGRLYDLLYNWRLRRIQTSRTFHETSTCQVVWREIRNKKYEDNINREEEE